MSGIVAAALLAPLALADHFDDSPYPVFAGEFRRDCDIEECAPVPLAYHTTEPGSGCGVLAADDRSGRGCWTRSTEGHLKFTSDWVILYGDGVEETPLLSCASHVAAASTFSGEFSAAFRARDGEVVAPALIPYKGTITVLDGCVSAI